MDELAKVIPASFISLVGLAVILAVLLIAGTWLQEWAKGYAKRGNRRSDRRTSDMSMEDVMIRLMETLERNNQEFHEFVTVWKSAWMKTIEESEENKMILEEIRRKQDANWKRLFNEEMPTVCKVK